MRSPVLCTIDQKAGNGGIARVSLLIWQVMQALFAERCRCVTLLPPGAATATWRHKCRLISTMIAGQLRGEFDWILFDHIGPATTQMLVPRPYRRPYGIFLHSVEVWSELSPSKLRILREATVRVANSRYTAERIQAAHGDVGRIDVCPLTLLPDALAPKSAGMPDEELLRHIRPVSVLIVGRVLSLERHKGHSQLIQAWPEVVKRVPFAQLVIVGEGDDLDFLTDMARQSGAAGDVLFTGWVSEATLDAVYDHVAVYAMPSNGEGFGLVFLEAMKHRLPCIASRTDASREIIVDGATGFLVDQSDRQILVDRIVALLADSRLRREMGEAGYQRLIECFSFEQFARRLGNALEPLQRR